MHTVSTRKNPAHLWFLSALAAVAAAPVPEASAGELAARPNIVVIMADDLDVHSLEISLGLGLMPALKRHLVDAGVHFTESFVTNSLCCPSRATFLTGQYSHNTGVLSNGGPHGGIVQLQDTSTLAIWLQAAGYRTGHVGKYLNGYGIDYVIGHDSRIPQYDPHYIPPGWSDWQALVDTTTYQVYGYTLNDNGSLVQPQAYQTDELAARAVDFISESNGVDEQPFLLVVTPLAPHVEIHEKTGLNQWRDLWRWTITPAPRHAGSVTLPLLPALKPSFNEADVSDKPLWRPELDGEDKLYLLRQYRNRLESLRAVDDLVGRVFEALAAAAELDRTVVFFTSDNGFLYGEHRLGEKLVAYEESLRVPLYVRLPGRPGLASDALVVNTDLAPTIAELAGVAPGLPVDGRSLAPLLAGRVPSDWRARFLVEHWWGDSVFEVPSFAAVRSGATDLLSPQTLYVEYYDQNYDQMSDGEADPVQFRELYDLGRDPYQLQSLHRDRARLAQMSLLSRLLGELKGCGGSPGQSRCQELESSLSGLEAAR